MEQLKNYLKTNNMEQKPLSIGIVRVSSTKQGLQGDSPEDQRKQIEIFANQKGFETIEFFEFWESAGGDKQPVAQVLSYCKKNNIKFAIIKKKALIDSLVVVLIFTKN